MRTKQAQMHDENISQPNNNINICHGLVGDSKLNGSNKAKHKKGRNRAYAYPYKYN